MIEVTDATGQLIRLEAPARRIVSLVPSETYSIAVVAGTQCLVGRTRFCVEPTAEVDRLPAVGGTKDVDLDAVEALGPDLVLANREENTRSVVQQLRDRGLTVHVSFPKTVQDSIAYLGSIARLVGKEPSTVQRASIAAVQQVAAAGRVDEIPVFVPIWRDPWMTFDANAFASDVLELLGARNVFADRPRRYPLAADLGQREAHTGARVEQRDTRYPRIRLEEVAERRPQRILLPDEPYAFSTVDAAELASLHDEARVVHVDGKDLFWYGARLPQSLASLATVLR